MAQMVALDQCERTVGNRSKVRVLALMGMRTNARVTDLLRGREERVGAAWQESLDWDFVCLLQCK